MKKKIEDYVHLYIGQQIQSWWGDIREIETIIGVAGDKIILDVDDDDIRSSIDMSFKQKKGKEVKLILRPISDTSEDEQEMFAEEQLDNYSFEETRFTISQIKFLLDNGFDLFGLIEDGLAVAKTKMY